MAREEKERQVVLPTSLVGPADITRSLRELETLNDFLRQAAARGSGETVTLPRMSKRLHDLAEANNLNLLQVSGRNETTHILESMRKSAPIAHVSFASAPSAIFTAKILTYMRQNIHPYILMQVGLQPSIAAGCVVRTTNKVFDFSLRQYLVTHRELLLQALSGMDKTMAQPTSAVAQSNAQPKAGTSA